MQDQSVEKIKVLQPGYGLYNGRTVLLSSRIRSQSWRSMLGSIVMVAEFLSGAGENQ